MVKIIKYSLSLLIVIGLIIGVIYFAYFKKDLKVTFNSNGGSFITPLNISFNGKLEEPIVPTKEGYTFDGWYLNNERFDFNTSINDNITLIAHWIKKEEVSCILSFDSLGGSNIDDIIIKKRSILESIPKPIKDGYEFVSWQYHNKEFDFTKAINNNMVLVAKYQKLEEENEIVTIKFDSQGGSKVEDLQIEKNSFVKMPPEPIKDGYKFLGWYIGDEEFEFLKRVDEDKILVAKWEKE